MAYGRKTGGREKGTPNKRRGALLKSIQEEFPDYHPVRQMARLANNEEADARLRFDADKEVASYVVPKLKSIDLNVSGQLGVGLKEISDEQWQALAIIEHGPESEGTD